MSKESNNAPRTASIVRTLCNAEGHNVVLRFSEPISIPAGKYDGCSYRTETLPKTTLKAKINKTAIEDKGFTLMCFAEIKMEEFDCEESNSSTDYGEITEGQPQEWKVSIDASREYFDEEDKIPIEEIEQAIEEGREDEILPPWIGPLTVEGCVERTKECAIRYAKSDSMVQYAAPPHEIGTLIDVRIID